MKNLKKQLTAFFVTLALTLSMLPTTALGSDHVASVSFDGGIAYYATIDEAWEAAVSLNTTAESKATIQLLSDCAAENTLTNTDDYLVLDTNGNTLTTAYASHPANSVLCGIGVDGGSLEIIGNGTITGVSQYSYSRAILLINGGAVYADGITIHNTGGSSGSNTVRLNGGEFHLLSGHLLSNSEYALSANAGKVYLHSGKIEGTGRYAMTTGANASIQLCYGEQPLYFINTDTSNHNVISGIASFQLADDTGMDVEYSSNPDGSDATTLKNATTISSEAKGGNYLKIQTFKLNAAVPYLFGTTNTDTLLSRIRNNGITETSADAMTAVHFVNLADYNLTNVACADYSANGDGSVKAWMDGTELYIGSYAKIEASESLAYAFFGGEKINSITGLAMLDTSNVTNMSYMFYNCGYSSKEFTLDLGENFDTSKVTDMSSMFQGCGYSSTGFTLNLGNQFNTSNVTNMRSMFDECGLESTVFMLDLGAQFDTSNVTDMSCMFLRCGHSSTEFTLNLGDKFDTSNVTDMSCMFLACGCESRTFTLDLGNLFDTSNVTDMSSMFQSCGASSRVFTLNLGDKFNTSKVTNMGHLFDCCGHASEVFTLDLGDKFDTSSATYMPDMFGGCGYNSAKFTLDLGDKFDTSKVTNMDSMFSFCGYGSEIFTLDLGDKFNTSKVTNMVNMFRLCGYSSPVFTLNLGNQFHTSKVSDMRYMFYNCGHRSNAFTTLDLSAFTLSAKTKLDGFAINTPITTFIFGDGWADVSFPMPGSNSGAFYTDTQIDTTITGATENLASYDWASDNRTADVVAPKTYTVTATAETGGTVSGGGEIAEGESATLIAAANDGYTFAGWYDGETKVCDTAEFVVSNVTADKAYTAKFTKNQAVEPDPIPSEFDFTTIRTLRAKDIVVNHNDKTITMTADGNVRNIAVYHDQASVIPGGTIKLSDAQGASVKQNPGSFYVISNAGTASVTVDITIGEVTRQYTLSVHFNEFVEKNLRMYQRKLGSTQKDIVYGTDVGYVAGNEIHITPNAGIEYIGLTKYQGTPGNYNGIITPVGTYPTYSTFEESTSSSEPVFVDWQGCIFVKRPTDGKRVEIDVNYTLGAETSVYKVIVDFSEEAEFSFSSIRTARAKNIAINHEKKTITMDADGKVSNIAVYQYQLGAQSNMQVTLADQLNADVTQNNGSFYVKDNGSGTATVLLNVAIGNTTAQYTLTVRFADAFDFTSIRALRTKNVVVDHENKTITVHSDGVVSNIAVYKAQNDSIKGGSITLADAQNASVVQNAGSFYVKNDGTGAASVLLNVTIGKVTKQYTLNVSFTDGFDFDQIRALRASEITIDHNTHKITITASKGAKNVALYMSQTGVIQGGKLTVTDEKDAKVQKNPGSYYIVKQDGVSESTVLADITIGGKTKTYEITVCFAD